MHRNQDAFSLLQRTNMMMCQTLLPELQKYFAFDTNLGFAPLPRIFDVLAKNSSIFNIRVAYISMIGTQGMLW